MFDSTTVRTWHMQWVLEQEEEPSSALTGPEEVFAWDLVHSAVVRVLAEDTVAGTARDQRLACKRLREQACAALEKMGLVAPDVMSREVRDQADHVVGELRLKRSQG